MTSVQKKESGAASSGLDSPAGTKVAIVTGASGGIGHGIAERLLEKGYCVVANSRNITRANTLQLGTEPQRAPAEEENLAWLKS